MSSSMKPSFGPKQAVGTGVGSGLKESQVRQGQWIDQQSGPRDSFASGQGRELGKLWSWGGEGRGVGY